MLLTSLLEDKQARREVDTMVYGIPSHLFVTKQQSCLYSINWFWIYILGIRAF